MIRSTCSTLCLIALLAAPLASGAETAAPAATPAAPAPAAAVVIADLRGETTPAYAYGSWTEKISRTENGVQVAGPKGAQGDGGFCGSLNTPLDLTGFTYLEVAVALGTSNEVPEFTVALGDADGTQASTRIRTEQISPSQAVWFRVPLASLRAATGEYAGKVAGFDASKVAQWHVQGDWNTKKPFQALVIAIRARR